MGCILSRVGGFCLVEKRLWRLFCLWGSYAWEQDLPICVLKVFVSCTSGGRDSTPGRTPKAHPPGRVPAKGLEQNRTLKRHDAARGQGCCGAGWLANGGRVDQWQAPSGCAIGNARPPSAHARWPCRGHVGTQSGQRPLWGRKTGPKIIPPSPLTLSTTMPM